MLLKNASLPPENTLIHDGILENDNFILAANAANISINNHVRLMDASSQSASVYQQHVFKLLVAYSEVDVLVQLLGVSLDVAGHAKSLYSHVYNFSDFEQDQFGHEAVVAGTVYIACLEKDQQRTMPEVFQLSHATTLQMLSVYNALKEFFAVTSETRRLLSDADKRLQSVYQKMGRFSNLTNIPPKASAYAKYVYKKIHDSDRLTDLDQKLIAASCLILACRQMKISRTIREIFATIPGATKAGIEKTFRSLEIFFAASKSQKTTETPHGAVVSTIAAIHWADRLVRTLHELTEQLALEEDSDFINRGDAAAQASFAPAAPSPTSMSTTDSDGTMVNQNVSTAPSTPLIANIIHASHDSNNVIRTLPPIISAPTWRSGTLLRRRACSRGSSAAGTRGF